MTSHTLDGYTKGILISTDGPVTFFSGSVLTDLQPVRYRIRNGLVAIPPDHLKLTTVATRRHETHYMQIRCNSCMYSQTFFPSTVRLWKRVPPDTCYLAPDSFKLELLKITSSDHAPSFYLTALHDFQARRFSVERNSYGDVAGWLAVRHSRYCIKTTKPIPKFFGPSGRPII